MARAAEERRHRRYNLSYPVRLVLRSGDILSDIEAMSRNVSIGGLLLETTSMIPYGSEVAFVITVKGNPVVRPIDLVGEGNVVRVEATSESAIRIAVQCKNAIAHIEDYFSQHPESANARSLN
jgi:hypothetical protein